MRWRWRGHAFHLFFFVHRVVMSMTCGSSIKIVLFCFTLLAPTPLQYETVTGMGNAKAW